MSRFINRSMTWLLVLLLVSPVPPPVAGQTAEATFKPEEIEQLVAPIALYPDSLVSQILMASTYPLEVVEADRWVKQNKNQKGDAFAAALEKQTWDPSVKSLTNFPQVLSMMDEKLELTQKLGDMFIAQQKDVLDAVQRLRAKAQESGNLKTTTEQKVIVEEKIIKIEPANPQVVYVPTYNPTVVYGAWPYPAYPPYPWYPPGYVATAAFSFAAGVAVGAAWGYAWGGCNWRGGNVDVDINRNVNINNTHINRQNYQANSQARGVNTSGQWQHDASHRKGVAYRDNATAQKFNRGTNAQAAQARESFRGRAESGRQDLARGEASGLGDRGGGIGGSAKSGDRGGLGDRSGVKGAGAGSGDRLGGQSNAGNRGGGSRDIGGGREAGAFQGLGKGGDVRNASSRGAASRASGGGARAGGGARSGGGARGGGGGGRRR